MKMCLMNSIEIKKDINYLNGHNYLLRILKYSLLEQVFVIKLTLSISEVITKNQKRFFDGSWYDSHTTMVNALSILGWGVEVVEAESVMLGQSISMQIPEVLGVNLGSLPEGVTATI